MQLPVKYGGMIGDPGEPLRHFIKDATGKPVLFSDEFHADYSGGDRLMKRLAQIINANSTAFDDRDERDAPPGFEPCIR